MKVPFHDLAQQDAPLRDEALAAIARVAARGWWVLGEEVAAFEREFAAACGVARAVGCANGTDAIRLALEAAGVGPGDEVVTVPHTALFTALAISQLGASPVFCDIEPESMTLDPARLEAAITPRTKAILPVHLYGQCADMDAILAVAKPRGIPVVEDAAQAHLAGYHGRLAGSLGLLAAFSFYPTKNLGAWGDGGAVVTNDPLLADRVARLRNGGQSTRFRHEERGVNSRLDELQAAVLRGKLRRLAAQTERRRALATRYAESLTGVRVPRELPGRRHVWHLYAIRHAQRDALAAALAERGVGTLVHYPVPAHLQPAYASLGFGPGAYPESERAAATVLSLPLHPGLTDAQQAQVIEAVDAFATSHG